MDQFWRALDSKLRSLGVRTSPGRFVYGSIVEYSSTNHVLLQGLGGWATHYLHHRSQHEPGKIKLTDIVMHTKMMVLRLADRRASTILEVLNVRHVCPGFSMGE